MIEPYDLDSDTVITWALSYADFPELERVAKTIYGVYVERRKKEYPDEQKANRKLRKDFRVKGKKQNTDAYARKAGPVRVIKPARRKP